MFGISNAQLAERLESTLISMVDSGTIDETNAGMLNDIMQANINNPKFSLLKTIGQGVQYKNIDHTTANRILEGLKNAG